MIDLDQEFKLLMQEVIDKVNDKRDQNIYAEYEAQNLINICNNIINHGDTSRYGNVCPDGHDNDLDCGWSPSMGYHCA